MVHLCGVMHGVKRNPLFSEISELPLYPSQQFRNFFSGFPKGKKVGIENLSEGEWQSVREDLVKKCEEAEVRGNGIYSADSQEYFNTLTDFCNKIGLEAVSIDSAEQYKRLNSAVVDIAKRRQQKDTSEKGKKGKLAREISIFEETEDIYKLEIKAREIYEIDRDSAILRNIKEKNVDIVVVGIGHSDYWFANKDKIVSEFGVNFDSYTTEEARDSQLGLMGINQVFFPVATPDLKRAYERKSLERVLKVIEGKNLTEKRPDFFGTWNMTEPSEGYFEVFLCSNNDRNGEIKGRIEDCNGSAIFNGNLSNGKLIFEKKYDPVCNEDTYKGDITYVALEKEEEFYGYYILPNFASAFYMLKGKKTPLEMAKSWLKFTNNNKNMEKCKDLIRPYGFFKSASS